MKTLHDNQQIYQRLKQTLCLGLRRQIFLIVCDNLNLRDRYINDLEREIKLDLDSLEQSLLFVSINLNLHYPDFFLQIAHWFKQNEFNISPRQRICFHIIGIEKLTKESPQIQLEFFQHLKNNHHYLSKANFNLLIWLSQPWLNSLEISAPEFWHWHTGIIEFEGEPTPIISNVSKPEPSINYDDSYFIFNHQNQSLNGNSAISNSPDLKVLDQSAQADYVMEIYDDEDIFLTEEDIFDLVQYDEFGNLITTDQELENYQKEDEETLNNTEEVITPTEVKQDFQFQLTLRDHQEKPSENIAKSQENYPQDSQDHTSLSLSNIQDLQNLEELNYPPEIIATACFQLAYQYRDLIAAGAVTKENLKIAIEAYQQGLKNLPEDNINLPDLLNDLGNLYWMLSRQTNNQNEIISLLEIAIQSYQLALLKLSQLVIQLNHKTLAMIQNNLGAVYTDLARFKEPEINFQLAIYSYQEALKYREKEEEPLKYAATKNNLGTAYWNLSQLTKSVPNLKEAIDCYQEALKQYDPEIYGLNWAMIQNNIGTAYWNLANYEEPEKWLHCAINCYHQALKYRTSEKDPVGYAATQNNLGTAYWYLGEQYKQDLSLWHQYLQQAITAYEIAIYFVDLLSKNNPPIPVNFEFLVTLNNLGSINYQIGNHGYLNLSLEEKSHYLDLALISYLKVLNTEGTKTEDHHTAFNGLIKTIKAKFAQEGIAGQTSALSKIPSKLLPEILHRL